MTSVSEAVILMAGKGSRLRQGYGGQARLHGSDKTFLKPLVPVLGRPLISYTLDAVTRAGIKTIRFVVGYESERVIPQVKQLLPSGVGASFIENRDWHKQNGISLLAVASHVRAPFLLTMGDHLFDDAIIDSLLDNSDPRLLNIAIDRKINSIFDLDDAMKVQTRADRVRGIGKDLPTYDAIDTGLFTCPPEIFDYLERAKLRSPESSRDCSLADAVRLMAVDNKVCAIDIGDARWYDIDTPQMLQHTEEDITRRGLRPVK